MYWEVRYESCINPSELPDVQNNNHTVESVYFPPDSRPCAVGFDPF